MNRIDFTTEIADMLVSMRRDLEDLKTQYHECCSMRDNMRDALKQMVADTSLSCTKQSVRNACAVISESEILPSKPHDLTPSLDAWEKANSTETK